MTSLLEKFHYRLQSLKTLLNEKGFRSAIKEVIYFNREAVIVERYLNKPVPKLKYDFVLHLTPLDRENPQEITEYKFPNKVRELKCLAYLNKGYKGFLGIDDRKVIAEQWYVCNNIKHPDLRWIELDLKNDEIYAFDLFVAPEYRGTSAINVFIASYLTELRTMGFSKTFGYFFSDNIPSQWIHRLFSYSEIKRIKRHRFFLLEIKNGKLCIA